MLNTFGDIRNDVLVKLNHTTTMAFYTEAILGAWINEAQSWAGAYKKWPFTEGRASTTFASLVSDEDGLLRGDYPEGFKADSIKYMTIGGKMVSKKEFTTFRKFIEDNTGNSSSNSNRTYSDYGRVYYVNPSIDLSGTVTVYGQYIPASMDVTDLNALSFFSGANDDGNEAISLEVQSYAKRRERKTQEAEFLHKEASAVLDRIWANYQLEQSNYQSADTGGMWKRFNVLSGNTVDEINNPNRWY